MRRTCAAILLAVVATSAGCGKEQPPPNARGGKPKQEITISFWHIINYTDVLDKAAARSERTHPGVRVKVETYKNDPYKSKLNVEMAGGSPPDVFFTWGGGKLAALARAKRILNLTQAMGRDAWRQDFLAPALRFCMVGGDIYAAPLDIACVPVWYNADMFRKLDIAPPKTLAELMAVCRKLRRGGVTPFALGNQDRWPGAFFFIYLAARVGGSHLFYDAAARKPGAAFNDRAFVRAGELLQDMVKAGAFPKGCNGVKDGAARTRFLNGKAAMYLMGTWLVARVRKEKPGFMPRLKCFAFPKVKGGKGDPTTVVGGVNCAFAVSSQCKSPGAAVNLVRALTSRRVAAEWAGIGRIPALKVGEKVLATLPSATRDALALLRGARTIQFYYDQSLPPRLVKVHKDTTQALFALNMTPGKAADLMEKTAQENK